MAALTVRNDWFDVVGLSGAALEVRCAFAMIPGSSGLGFGAGAATLGLDIKIFIAVSECCPAHEVFLAHLDQVQQSSLPFSDGILVCELPPYMGSMATSEKGRSTQSRPTVLPPVLAYADMFVYRVFWKTTVVLMEDSGWRTYASRCCPPA